MIRTVSERRKIIPQISLSELNRFKKGIGVQKCNVVYWYHEYLTKIYEICLKDRLEQIILPCIPREQTAYQYERRGCEEHIFTAKVLSEKFGKNLIILLTDFQKRSILCVFALNFNFFMRDSASNSSGLPHLK